MSNIPEEERPCLSKYWKIYFPDREINPALFFFFRLFVLQFFANLILHYRIRYFYFVAVALANTVNYWFSLNIIKCKFLSA